MFAELLWPAALASVDVRSGALHDIVGAGDFNADGLPDLIIEHDDIGVVEWRNSGGGQFSPGPVFAYPSPVTHCGGLADVPGSAAIGDDDGDGYDDVLVLSASHDDCTVHYLKRGGAAGLTAGLTPLTREDRDIITLQYVGDTDGDQAEERVAFWTVTETMCEWAGTYWPCSEQVPGCTVEYRRSPTTRTVESLGDRCDGRAGDTNGDGLADLLFAGSYDAPVTWTAGTTTITWTIAPDWTWSPWETPDGGGATRRGAWVGGVGDSNGDGLADMVSLSEAVTSWMDWFPGRPWGFDAEPSGRLWPPITLVLDEIATTADFNGDGTEEVVLVGRGGEDDAWLLFYEAGEGDRWPAYSWPLTTEPRPRWRQGRMENAGDLDDSGGDDLIVDGEVVLAPECAGGPPGVWLVDRDGDGQGDGTHPILACEEPDDSTEQAGDCDDQDARVYSGSTELVDRVDADCDGWVLGWEDTDRDGAPGTPVWIPEHILPTRYYTYISDCDDSDSGVRPGAYEPPPALRDLNCDGALTCFTDLDGDGSGSPAPSTTVGATCDDASAGVADDANDCDDADPLLVGQRFYRDGDVDGYGGGSGVVACVLPPGYSSTPGDCDDSRADVSPAGVEVMAGPDEDCDGFALCYHDADRDTYGGAPDLVQSSRCSGTWSDRGGDCDDSSSRARPGGVEVVDRWDNDCDGSWECYVDGDVDGWGDEIFDGAGDAVTTVTVGACGTTPGTSWEWGDCDPTDPTIHPDAPEILGGVDENCNGRYHCYVDWDRDGFGDLPDAYERTGTCETRTGMSSVSGDCNDWLATINPGRTEVPGGEDDDCDGLRLCVVDADGDGSGGPAVEQGTPCATALSTPDVDCDDLDPSTHPGADEPMFEDRDCDGARTCFRDRDSDGFGSTTTLRTTWTTCAAPTRGLADNAADCDDGRADVSPAAAEVPYDGRDQDCDGHDTFRLVARPTGATGALEVRLSGVPAGTPVRVYGSRLGTGAEPCLGGGVCGGLSNPREVAAAVAGPTGVAIIPLQVPGGTSTVWLQGFGRVAGATARTVVVPVTLGP